MPEHDGPAVPAAAGATAQAFVRACWLDVAVRKPGNVSVASPGHGMTAQDFVASALAAAGPLCTSRAPVGARIERAVTATWQTVGCNTNLGIVLLAAPIAAAVERAGAQADAAALRRAAAQVMDSLDLQDTQAAYRAIARANPGGLGSVPQQDVHETPAVGLRDAMALAAGRDSIARQFTIGLADLFDVGLAALGPGAPGRPLLGAPQGVPPDAEAAAAVRRVFIAFLARWPDSHIVRKHGAAVAHTVMTAAQDWVAESGGHDAAAWSAWDDALKRARINPGTTADLTVATLMLAGVLDPAWHGT